MNRAHPLLERVLAPTDHHTLRNAWGSNDHDGHGTQMAGLAAYGDLVAVLQHNQPVVLNHRLESVKILDPNGPTDPSLWGALTVEAMGRAEVAAPNRRRAFCLAVGSRETRDQGMPSSWSAALDTLASGAEDGHKRLIVVAAGNVPANAFTNYPASNETEVVHDPAQAWNALTVGALADRDTIREPSYRGWRPIAPINDISPSSSTSVAFKRGWPLKPEIVMPGGNAAVDPAGTEVAFVPDLQLLSTSRNVVGSIYAPSGETSAAAALASRLGAQIEARYPSLWPEAVRALIVHSAEWTSPMQERHPGQSKAAVEQRLRTYGFGVPNGEVALASASNVATLVTQQAIQPFKRKADGTPGSNVMHLHALPLPVHVLRRLREAEVELRVTLSYFIEPAGARQGFTKRHRYSSFALRFDLQTPTENESQFTKRVNAAALAEDEKPETASDSSDWLLGKNLRSLGSLHSDRWRGSAVDLAARRHLAVYPAGGWWRERVKLERLEKETRYALVVSILAKSLDVDIYTEISSQISIPISIEP